MRGKDGIKPLTQSGEDNPVVAAVLFEYHAVGQGANRYSCVDSCLQARQSDSSSSYQARGSLLQNLLSSRSVTLYVQTALMTSVPCGMLQPNSGGPEIVGQSLVARLHESCINTVDGIASAQGKLTSIE